MTRDEIQYGAWIMDQNPETWAYGAVHELRSGIKGTAPDEFVSFFRVGGNRANHPATGWIRLDRLLALLPDGRPRYVLFDCSRFDLPPGRVAAELVKPRQPPERVA